MWTWQTTEGWVTALAVVGATAAALVGGLEGAAIACGLVVLAAIGLCGARLAGQLSTPGERPPPRPEATAEGETEPLLEGLWPMLFAGLLLRLVVVVVVNASPLWLAFGRDAMTWEWLGKLAFAEWLGPEAFAPYWMDRGGKESFFAFLNGLAVVLFGSARYPMSVLNAFMGVGVAFLVARLAYALYDRRVGRRAFIWVLFYPSLLLWSTMNLREVWAHAAILVVLLAAHRVRTRFAPLALLLLLGALSCLYLIRPYLLPILLLSVLASMVVVRARHVPYTVFGLVVIAGFLHAYGESFGLSTSLLSTERLEDVQELRQALADGGSAYGADVDTSTLAGSLAYLPEGVLRFLFAPFPWSVRSWQQVLALPESLLFAILTYQALRQVLFDVTRRPTQVVLPALTALLITCAYGLVSGNEGTAFRHRAQVVVIVLVFSSAYQVRRHARLQASHDPAGSESQRPPSGLVEGRGYPKSSNPYPNTYTYARAGRSGSSS